MKLRMEVSSELGLTQPTWNLGQISNISFVKIGTPNVAAGRYPGA